MRKRLHEERTTRLWTNHRLLGNCRETRFEAISFCVNHHTERGVGGRQYGTSEKGNQTLRG